MSRAAGLALASLLWGCEPDLVVGTWTCTTSAGPAAPDDGGTSYTGLVESSWKTGFEDGFCGYNDASGWCYAHPGASYASVLSPVHGGKRAAAFVIGTADAGGGTDARCAREGTFPSDAYYGAWFYLPVLPQTVDNWNLIHFQGRNPGDNNWMGTWDVTLTKTGDGGFGLTIVKDFAGQPIAQQHPPDVEVGSWFHVVVRYLRSTDTGGEITLYQGDPLHELLDVKGVTDPYTYDQWYVGDLVNSTTEPELTVYVDDVSVSTSP